MKRFYIFVIFWATALQSFSALSAEKRSRCIRGVEFSAETVQIAEIEAFVQRFSGQQHYQINQWFLDRLAKSSPVFSEYLTRQAPRPTPLETYYHFILSEIGGYKEGARLQLERDVSLSTQLKIWGAEKSSLSGFEQLAVLSAENKQRVVDNHKLKPVHTFPVELQLLLAELTLRLRHNSDTEALFGDYMLSSLRLSGMGLLETAQARTNFNRQFLQSHDQLYFYASPALKSDPKPSSIQRGDPYGEQAHFLKFEFAKKHGWISPYVMTEGDLLNYAEAYAPFNGGRPVKTLEQARSQLHENVYTPKDYLDLLKLILGNYILFGTQEGYLPSPTKVMGFLKGQAPQSDIDRATMFRELAIHYGVSGGLMELKVPVSLPTDQIQ